MTANVIDWLPKDAFAEDAVKSVLADTVACWSERWFARRPATVSTVRIGSGEPRLSKGSFAGGRVTDVEMSGPGKRRLLEEILDIDLSAHVLKQEDHRTLDALVEEVIIDLIAAMDDLFGCEGTQKEPPRICLSISTREAELLRASFPSRVLVPMLKAKLGGPQKSDREIRNRVAALKSLRLAAEGVLGNANISLTDLSELAVGDVLILDRSVHEPVDLRLRATGQLVGKGRLERASGRTSIHF